MLTQLLLAHVSLEELKQGFRSLGSYLRVTGSLPSFLVVTYLLLSVGWPTGKIASSVENELWNPKSTGGGIHIAGWGHTNFTRSSHCVPVSFLALMELWSFLITFLTAVELLQETEVGTQPRVSSEALSCLSLLAGSSSSQQPSCQPCLCWSCAGMVETKGILDPI